MNWPTHLFSYSKTRQRKRLALNAWTNRGLWPAVSLASTGHPWLWLGSVPVDQNLHLQHVSAYRALDRDALVQYWVPRIRRDAFSMALEDKSILQRWAHVENRLFWQALSAVFEHPLRPKPATRWSGSFAFWEYRYWGTVLAEAGRCGNIAAFEAAPEQALELYMAHQPEVHPHVGLWLHAKGFCSMEQLHAHINASYRIGGDGFGILAWDAPVTADFIAQWCVSLLRDYGLHPSQKVGVVGQAIVAFGKTVWETHLAPVCQLYLEGIDMDLLYLVCQARERDLQNPFETSVWFSSQRFSKGIGLDSEGTSASHVGLEILLEYTPPDNLIDLYVLASKVKDGERGIARSDILELPALV